MFKGVHFQNEKCDCIKYLKLVDYACGAGHFLTQGFEAVNDCVLRYDSNYSIDSAWAEHKIYGVEKDYRLARVSKISLFMHGAGDGNIIFGDGLENYPDKSISNYSFDILVANPPYSVKAFKPHLKLKDNSFSILDKISNNGSEIETLFVERITQVLKPLGIAAVILPVSILNKDNNSFVSAREEILKNFKIIAIVHLGKNTFSETGQSTIVMFLEKYDEPPKRINLVQDSVDAIWENRCLDDWEDVDILRGYLSKIGVEYEEYETFIEGTLHFDEWPNDSYFAMYYDDFVASNEYSTKMSQKTFQNLSSEEQYKWLDERFYANVKQIESEKLLYYALIYPQKVVIISSPNDKKEEEQFLGYKWKKRKGQEGIQIINAGGMLYDPYDRNSDTKLCSIVRHAFYDEELSIEELRKYFYFLNLQDMIDFSSISFTKAIKTAKCRKLKTTPGLISYKLSDKSQFTLSIGDRVLSTEGENDGGIPIISANVYEEFGRINKQNIKDFSLPSVIWGIDGEWMVNYIEKDYPFYPTDHCGVLRISTDKILPEYFALALQVEGEYEKFSRSNRASTQRIKSLTIQVPEMDIQQQIVDMMKKFANDIRYNKIKLSDIDKKSRNLLADYIGDICREDGILEKMLKIFNKNKL